MGRRNLLVIAGKSVCLSGLNDGARTLGIGLYIHQNLLSRISYR